MDLHYLEIFNAVAKYSSFKKASEILHITQPALSIQVKKLENQTGLKLFYKVGNKISLSDNGLMLYEYTKEIFSIIDEMETSISNQKAFVTGTINLGGSNTPGTYILPNIIGEVKKLYPNIKVNLHIADTSEITTLIDNATLDVAINGGNCNYNSYVYAEKLFDDRLVIVASPNNSLCEKEKIEVDDLKEVDFVVHNTTSQLYTCFRKIIDAYHIPENVSMSLGSIDAIKHAVYADLGLSIMPYFAVKQEIEIGMLKELNFELDSFSYPYSLIYNKNKYLSSSTQKFIEVLRQVIPNLR